MSIQVYQQVFGAFSFISSGSVVITGFLFRGLLIDSRKVFSSILFYISLADMLVGLGYSFGYPTNGSFLCSLQGFLISFFSPASWIWTTLLVFQLRTAVIYRRLWINFWHMHLICWITTSMIAFVPFAIWPQFYTSADGKYVCVHSGSPLVITLEFFVVIMVICIANVAWYLLSTNEAVDISSNSWALLKSMILYPIGIVLFWFPLMLISWTPKNNTTRRLEVCLIIESQAGTALAIAYYTQTHEARVRWAKLFGCFHDATEVETQSSRPDGESFCAAEASDTGELELTEGRKIDRNSTMQTTVNEILQYPTGLNV